MSFCLLQDLLGYCSRFMLCNVQTRPMCKSFGEYGFKVHLLLCSLAIFSAKRMGCTMSTMVGFVKNHPEIMKLYYFDSSCIKKINSALILFEARNSPVPQISKCEYLVSKQKFIYNVKFLALDLQFEKKKITNPLNSEGLEYCFDNKTFKIGNLNFVMVDVVPRTT